VGTWSVSPGFKRQGREAARASPSDAVENAWSLGGHSPYPFVAWFLIKYTGNFTRIFQLNFRLWLSSPRMPCLFPLHFTISQIFMPRRIVDILISFLHVCQDKRVYLVMFCISFIQEACFPCANSLKRKGGYVDSYYWMEIVTFLYAVCILKLRCGVIWKAQKEPAELLCVVSNHPHYMISAIIWSVEKGVQITNFMIIRHSCSAWIWSQSLFYALFLLHTKWMWL
jgi:hypothetical protein